MWGSRGRWRSSLSCCHLNKDPGPSSQSPLQESTGAPEIRRSKAQGALTLSAVTPLSLHTTHWQSPPSKPTTPQSQNMKAPVILTCLADDTGVSIAGSSKGQSLLLAERMTLSSDKSTLTIDPVSRGHRGLSVSRPPTGATPAERPAQAACDL